MKNILFNLVLSFFLILGNLSVAQADGILQGGIEVDIHFKTGNTVHSVLIPNKYLKEDGSLVIPLEINLLSAEGKAVYTFISQDLSVTLPLGLSGVYVLELKIGDVVSMKKVVL